MKETAAVSTESTDNVVVTGQKQQKAQLSVQTSLFPEMWVSRENYTHSV